MHRPGIRFFLAVVSIVALSAPSAWASANQTRDGMTGPLAVTVGDAFYVTFNKGANFKGVCGVLGMDGIDTPESGGQYTRTVKGKAKFKLLVRSTGQNPRVDFTCISGAKSLTWNDIAFGNAMYIYVRG